MNQETTLAAFVWFAIRNVTSQKSGWTRTSMPARRNVQSQRVVEFKENIGALLRDIGDPPPDR